MHFSIINVFIFSMKEKAKAVVIIIIVLLLELFYYYHTFQIQQPPGARACPIQHSNNIKLNNNNNLQCFCFIEHIYYGQQKKTTNSDSNNSKKNDGNSRFPLVVLILPHQFNANANTNFSQNMMNVCFCIQYISIYAIRRDKVALIVCVHSAVIENYRMIGQNSMFHIVRVIVNTQLYIYI